jgi:branched-chain amino acid transport system ATP-binding protein
VTPPSLKPTSAKPMPEPILALDGVDAGYGELQILWKVRLHVEPAEIVSLIGPNGAGKTTVIKTILGVVPVRRGPGRGGVRFQGERIEGLAPEAIVTRGIAVVPEGARVFPDMTVRDNLLMGAIAARARTREAQSLGEVFALFPRLAERQRQLAGSLSGGERQMLAIGRALMACPALLLLDEPSLGLAPLIVREFFRIVRRLNEDEGLTVLVVEQDARIALAASSRAYVLEVGRVALTGTSAELRDDESIRRSYLGY